MVPFVDERDHVYLHPAEFIQMDLIPLSSLPSLSSMLLINRPFRASQAFPGQDVFVHKSVLPGSLESWNGHQLGWLQLCSLEGVVSHGMYVHSPSNRSLRAFFWGHFLLKQKKFFIGKTASGYPKKWSGSEDLWQSLHVRNFPHVFFRPGGFAVQGGAVAGPRIWVNLQHGRRSFDHEESI